MRKWSKIAILMLGFVQVNNALFAQNSNQDAQFRMQLAVEKKLASNYNIQISCMSKLDDNFSRNRQNYLEFQLERKLNKYFKFGFNHRIISNKQLQGYNWIQYKSGLYLNFKVKKRLWTFEERIFVQSPNWSLNPSRNEYGTKPLRLRFKTTISRRINKYWDIYSGVELYLNSNNSQYPILARFRMPIGVEYKINKDLNIKPYFMYQNRVHKSQPRSVDFIYGVSLKYNLN